MKKRLTAPEAATIFILLAFAVGWVILMDVANFGDGYDDNGDGELSDKETEDISLLGGLILLGFVFGPPIWALYACWEIITGDRE